MANRFVVLAGRKILPIIRDEGLNPDRVQIVAGAAGGPKWLVLYGLDRWLFGELFKDRREPLHLIGSSIGSWRFAAVSVNDPVSGIDRFKEAYFRQRYSANPGPEEISREVGRVLERYIGDDEIRQILDHPSFRMSMLAVRCRNHALASEFFPRQAVALGIAAACNAVARPWLRFFFERTLFHHPAGNGFWSGFTDFIEQRVALGKENFRRAMMASGSIPLVMSGISDIPGAPEGVYRDGGIIDYHLNLPFPCDPDRIVFFPHYTNRIVPGWFDKKVFWRRPVANYLDNVLLVAPSPDFIVGLPLAKISDRGDFKRFTGRDDDRIRYWQTVVDQSRRMAADFQEAVGSGRIREQVRPLA